MPLEQANPPGETGVIASGIAGLYAEEALMDLDLDHTLLRIGAYPAQRS